MKISLHFLAIALASLLAPALAQGQTLFASDAAKGNIYKITPGAAPSTVASGLNDPTGLAVDSAGDVFEADDSGNIYKFTPGGVQSSIASGVDPIGLAFDSAGNLFAIDPPGDIYKFAPDGTRSTFASIPWPASGIIYLQGLAVDNAGDVFVSDWYGSEGDGGSGGYGTIYKITPGGVQSTFASGLDFPEGLAIDSAGNVFVSAMVDNSIYKITPAGTLSTFASGLDGPYGLAFDNSGNLFEADQGSGNIYEFTSNGGSTTFASGLNEPWGLAVQPVPEPSTWAMVGIGVIALLAPIRSGLGVRRRRQS